MATFSIRWQTPIILRSGYADKLIYTCDLESVPATAGVYVFGRYFGETFAPVYIGQTGNLQTRIWQHFRSVPLMMSLQSARNGSRYLHIGKLRGKQGQDEKSALQRVERAMIKYALAQGHEIVNDRGTKTPYDSIEFSGNRYCTRVFGSSMHVEKK